MTHPRSNNCRANQVQKTDTVTPLCEGILAHRRQQCRALCGKDRTRECFPPYAPPSPARISYFRSTRPWSPLREAPYSPACEPGGQATRGHCSQKGGPLAKSHLHRHRTLPLGLCSAHTPLAQHGGMPEEAYDTCLPWCDNCSPAKPPFSCVEWCCCRWTLRNSFQYS